MTVLQFSKLPYPLSQPACLEKSVTLLYLYLLSLYFAMASGSRNCYTPCRNPCGNLTASFARTTQGPAKRPAKRASTTGSEAATVSSHAGTPAPSQAPTLASAPTLFSIDELFKQFIQVYLELVKNSSLAEPKKKPLKTRFLDIYWGKSHMNCYHFCQQCKDHVDIAGATSLKRIPFVALFLQELINYHWEILCRPDQSGRSQSS